MKIRVTIKGISPLLMNRFTEQAEIKISGGTSSAFQASGNRGNPREQAEPKRYSDAQGNLYIPGANVFSCLVAAGIFIKVGRSKLTTQKSSLVPAGLMVDDLICSLGTKDWEVDSRSVVIPATGGRIMCHRPRIDQWSLTFNLDVDEEMFSPDLVRQLVDAAGKKVGLGDWRPSRKGPFGRFVVDQWAAETKPRTLKKAA